MAGQVPYQPPRRGQQCALAFVGDAPTERDVDARAPFSGPEGRVFNALLRTAGIERYDCLLTNLFDARPDPDLDSWVKDPERLAAAVVRLQAELAAHQPVVVIPVGDAALLALAGVRGIMGYRGNVMPAVAPFSPRKLVPSLDPAFVMREYKFFTPVVGDLLKAVKEVGKGPGIIRPPRRLLIDPTEEEVHAALSLCRTAPLLSVDIETAFGQMTHIGLAWTEEDAICVPFQDSRKANNSYWPDVDSEHRVLEAVRGVLESGVPKVGQNYGGYDALWLLEKYAIRTFNFREDTRLQHHALFAELKKSLEFLGSGYSDQGPWKKLGRRADVDGGKKGDE